ncbi:hypothetical protein SAMN04488541_107211 [Thermoflexibacter ruber]|uniref:Thioredoxin n=1 Tax=Thermoflexibacter ruber TaxID=1003 RepID=A0A1I2JZE8_9BACT|nr:hypothetical protein SAMN04488541_107211 [Thermoflexibacter ruber]
MVTNPFCPPCAKTHAEIEKLIASNENLNCQVVFTATNEETDIRGEVAKHILSFTEYYYHTKNILVVIFSFKILKSLIL